MTSGRPPTIETPEQFDSLVDAYIAAQQEDGKPVTLTGALLALGLKSRTSLLDYEKREGFSEPVKRLRLIIENAYEEKLHGTAPTGAIFALKNMGWFDRTQQELTGANGGPIETKEHGTTELARRLAFLLTRGAVQSDDGSGGDAG